MPDFTTIALYYALTSCVSFLIVTRLEINTRKIKLEEIGTEEWGIIWLFTVLPILFVLFLLVYTIVEGGAFVFEKMSNVKYELIKHRTFKE